MAMSHSSPTASRSSAKRLVNAADRTREDRPSAIKGVAIHGLPMMRDRARVFADQVRNEFLDGSRNGFGATFDNRLTQPSNACIRIDLQEEPARLHHESLDFGDLEFGADAVSCFCVL